MIATTCRLCKGDRQNGRMEPCGGLPVVSRGAASASARRLSTPSRYCPPSWTSAGRTLSAFSTVTLERQGGRHRHVDVRLSLRDLLIAMLFGLGAGISSAQLSRVGAPASPLLEIVPWLVALVTYLVASSFIYSRLRWRPMWYPLCPTCKDADRLFRFPSVKPAWPREEISCCKCGSVIELWYQEGVNTVSQSGSLPSFTLLWPRSWGRWRRRAIGHATSGEPTVTQDDSP